MAPALSPQLAEWIRTRPRRDKQIWTDMVTLEGSPPKAGIYFWTHFNARRSVQLGELAELNEDAPTHDLEGRGCLSLPA